VDLDGFYQDQSLFIVGGGPSLADVDLDPLRRPGVITLGLNNTPLVFKPNLWLGADEPSCFSPHLYALPEVTKLMPLGREEKLVGGKLLREHPSCLFFGVNPGFKPSSFLTPNRDLVWWQSVFPMALQLAHRLGFREVFLVGCDLSYGGSYAWESKADAKQAQYSQRTYDDDVARLGDLVPVFEAAGFGVTSCTPGSAAHAAGVPYAPLEEVVDSITVEPADPRTLTHSSELVEAP
jgi:hypothetical protein